MLKYYYMLKEEIRRMWIIMKRYWMNTLSMAITVYLFYLIMVLMGGAMGGQPMSNADKASTLVGMLFWMLSLGSMSVLGWSFFNEAATGTLEHLYLSPMGVSKVFLARSVADFVTNLVIVVASGGLAMVTTGVRLQLPLLEIIIILPLAVAGTYGFGFMLAALTLTFKKTQQFMNLTQFFFLFFAGMIIPLEKMHWTLRYFGATLPISAGVQAMREVTINGARLGDLGSYLIQMTVTSVVWLAIGVAIYSLADRRARLRGSIGQY